MCLFSNSCDTLDFQLNNRTTMKPTAEQQVIFDCKEKIIKIRAGAGTGKTTTLQGITQFNPRTRFLYLAFNKAIKEEASKKFGGNVRSMTAHGMAFGRIGRYYAEVPEKLSMTEIKPYIVLPYLEKSLKKAPTSLHILYGGRVLETITRFLVSDCDFMETEHISVGASPGEVKYFDTEQILKDAQFIWECMQDIEHPMPISHDGYLKLFQLEKSDLGFDSILMDEAQDTNPVTQAILTQQKNSQLIYVGDEHQAIYSFRGARNAMAEIEALADFKLTGSFRFGPEIAEIANHILASKGETDLRIRGLAPNSVVGKLPLGTPHAYIARGNSALFARAVDALDSGQKFSFVGPLTNYRLDLMVQAFLLSDKKRDEVTDPFLKSFNTFEELEEYGNSMEDRDIMGRCKLVTRYGGRIPYLVSQIRKNAGTYPSKSNSVFTPDVILSSGHRSKGLEFDNVILADDYLDFFDEDRGELKDITALSGNEVEDVNLQYVAVTRAKRFIELGGKLERFIKLTKFPPTESEKAAMKKEAEDNRKKKAQKADALSSKGRTGGKKSGKEK